MSSLLFQSPSWLPDDWKTLLLGEEQWAFLLETAFRTILMFVVILFCLRLMGKRGIKQLSVFELGVIIGLGSAAGDPMFYKDVGLLPGMLVIVVMVTLYRGITWMINRSNRFEQFMEGDPVCVVEKGCFLLEAFKNEPLARDEFFAQLRIKGVSHLGQVERSIIEIQGEVSVFYFPAEKVQWGLPILPHLCSVQLDQISEAGIYACANCATTRELPQGKAPACPSCEKDKWTKAIRTLRVT